MSIPFRKMSGAGNDFLVVDNRAGILPEPIATLAPTVCARTTPWGGADGLIAIVNSTEAEFEMLYFNADGSAGAMCGNGGRCAARFALTEHIARSAHITFRAVGQTYSADVDGSRVRLAMPPPRTLGFGRTIDVLGRSVTVHFIDVETAHAVIFIADIPKPSPGTLREFDIATWGPAVRHHPMFAPAGANANFALIKPNGTVVLRTYERGVEGETLACGTGAVATALAAHFVHGIAPPVRVATASGETLVVDFDRDGNTVRNLSLEGTAVVVSTGFMDLVG